MPIHSKEYFFLKKKHFLALHGGQEGGSGWGSRKTCTTGQGVATMIPDGTFQRARGQEAEWREAEVIGPSHEHRDLAGTPGTGGRIRDVHSKTTRLVTTDVTNNCLVMLDMKFVTSFFHVTRHVVLLKARNMVRNVIQKRVTWHEIACNICTRPCYTQFRAMLHASGSRYVPCYALLRAQRAS